MNKSRLFAYISVLMASDLPFILFQPTLKLPNITFRILHVTLMLLLAAVSYFRIKTVFKLNLLLLAVNAGYLLTTVMANTPQYPVWFKSGTFIGQIGGSILLKMVVAALVLGFLLVLCKKQPYLSIGNLSIKAEKIGWLGIPGQRISWGRLALISAILISLGTFLGTVVTVTGFTFVRSLSTLISLLPFVLLFALGNSLFEGIIYRNSILASLTGVLEKNDIVLLGTIFFGIAHYYGAPGGIIGIGMSTALGWYLCRGMLETKGLFSSWLIHFFQDVVIFSALILLGGYGIR